MYDKNNLFARIIRGEVITSKVYEDKYVLAINDIKPVAPIHILVLPKGEYINFNEFSQKATKKELTDYFKKVSYIAKLQGVKEYRIITNNGFSSGQTIFHFHTHIIGGRDFYRLI